MAIAHAKKQFQPRGEHNAVHICACVCRPEFWFWESVTIWLTLIVGIYQGAAATALPLTTFLVYSVMGFSALVYVKPMVTLQSQVAQVHSIPFHVQCHALRLDKRSKSCLRITACQCVSASMACRRTCTKPSSHLSFLFACS